MTLLGLKLRQTQQLNQGLQQSLRVLQMSGLELEREVDDWLQDNPLLERREPAEDGRFEPTRLSAAVSSRNQIGGEDAEDVWATIADEEDFKRYLHNQVCEHPLSEQEAARVHILIDSLDEQGYLTDSLEEIIDNTPLNGCWTKTICRTRSTGCKTSIRPAWARPICANP